MEETKNKEDRKKEHNKQFYTMVAVPIATFVLGTIFAEMKSTESATWAILLLFVLWYIRFIGRTFLEILHMLRETTPVKMRYLYDELQDLYDRDYLE